MRRGLVSVILAGALFVLMLATPYMLILFLRDHISVAAQQPDPEQSREERAAAVARGLAKLEEFSGTRELTAAREEIKQLKTQVAAERKATMQAKKAAEEAAAEHRRLIDAERESAAAEILELAAAREEIERLRKEILIEREAALQAKEAAKGVVQSCHE